jgi:DNA polymerase III subunit gamma/tau
VSYQVLARKYRPQTFEEVVGQKPIVTTLQNAVANRRIHHAYLFSGLRGVGKTTVARLMAKSLNCVKGPAPVPCNACPSCLEIAETRSMDVLEIDGASNRGIDAVRELRETVRYAPARDRYKVYIIDEVHMLTNEAWNALLKTLEEPPAHVVFLFATTDYRKLPLTILSRCQHFEFKKIPQAEMAAHLGRMAAGEKVQAPPAVIDLISRMAEGSLRDAQSALDQVIAFSGATVTEETARTILGVIDRDLILDFYDAVRGRDYTRLVEIVETVFEKGYQPTQFLEDLMAYGRDLLLVSVVADPARHIVGGADEVQALRERSAKFAEDELLRILELMTREEQRVKNSSHPRFLLEALAIKLARLADLRPIEELVAQVAGTASGRPPGEAEGATPKRPAGPSSSDPKTEPRSGAQSGGDGAAAPAGTRDQAVVETFLKRVHEERGALGGFLEAASWIEIEGEVLEIAFGEKHLVFREKIEARENLDYLRRVAREAAGRDLAIRVTVATPGVVAGRASAQGETDETRKERLRREAERAPMVRSLLDTLGGRIVDVDPV